MKFKILSLLIVAVVVGGLWYRAVNRGRPLKGEPASVSQSRAMMDIMAKSIGGLVLPTAITPVSLKDVRLPEVLKAALMQSQREISCFGSESQNQVKLAGCRYPAEDLKIEYFYWHGLLSMTSRKEAQWRQLAARRTDLVGLIVFELNTKKTQVTLEQSAPTQLQVQILAELE